MPMPLSVHGKPVKTGAWTEEEDYLLAYYQEQFGNRWSKVCKAIVGRTGQQCAQRWRHKVNPNIKKEKWTAEEDQKLMDLFQEYGCAWAEISRHITGRTDQQCMGRWRRHLDPGIRREAWKPTEDEDLAFLHSQYGCQWATIAKHMCSAGRTAQQCRARWYQLESEENDLLRSVSSPKKTVRKVRKPKAKKHSAYSESDEDCHQNESDSACSEGFHNSSLHHRRQSDARFARRLAAEDPEISELEGEAFSPHKMGIASSNRKSRGRVAVTRTKELQYKDEPNASQHSGQTALAQPTRGGQWVDGAQEARGAFRSYPANFESAADDEEPDHTPRSVSSMSARSLQHPGSDSPPFLAPHSGIHRRAESGLLSNMPHSHRSPNSRIFATPSRFAPKPSPRDVRCTPEGKSGGSMTPTPLQSSRRQTPNQRIQDSAWKTSPLDNVLSLFHSPEGRSRPEFLSPAFQNLATPDWVKKHWASSPSAQALRLDHPGSQLQEDIPSTGAPLSRGFTARKLDVESALRGQSSASRELRHVPLADNVRGGQAHEVLVSPAKRSKHHQTSSAHGTPSKLQRYFTSEERLETAGTPTQGDGTSTVRMVPLTEKENSACCALKQLSMIAIAMEEASELGSANQLELSHYGKLHGSHEPFEPAEHPDMLLGRFQ